MNEQNLNFLERQLFYSGFGEKLSAELQEKMQAGQDFTLNHREQYGTDRVQALLYFKKSDKNDFFYFNKYTVRVEREGQEEPRQQTFYTDNGITLKEGYNLLEGRAVYKILSSKDDQKYPAWLQLDFSSIHPNGNYGLKKFFQQHGYDLEKILGLFSIREMEDPWQKEILIKSLQKGNLHQATFRVNGEALKCWITPNLSLKTIAAFDSLKQPVPLQSLLHRQEALQKLNGAESLGGTLSKEQKHEPESPDRKQKPKNRLS